MTDTYNIKGILNQPQFNALSPERKDLLINLSEKIKDKSGMESVAIISDFMKKLPKGDELTRGEQELMAEAFLESLPTPARTRFQNVINMVKKIQS